MDWYQFFLLFSLNFVDLVFADKNDIKIASTQSWMSKKTFATLLQVSLNSSRCSTINLYGTSIVADNLFHEFVKIYPYDYVLHDRSGRCAGYFIVTTSVQELVNAMKFIPTKMATLEMLIILDKKVVHPTRLFNVSIYDNANVNIAAHNGLWTLSENYLKPRIFKEVSRPEEMVHKSGMVDLKGRELRATTFYQPPFSYLETTVNQTVNGIETKLFTAKERPEFDGIVINVFQMLARKLNATWTIRRPSDSERYGIVNGSHLYGGVIGQIIRKEVDIAITDLAFTNISHTFANVTFPYAMTYIGFLVPRPKPQMSFWALAKQFRLEVWSVLLLMLIVMSVYMYTRARLFPSSVPNRFRSLNVTLIELMGSLLNTTGSWNIRGLKLEFLLWYYISLLLVTAYSSNLAARLTAAIYEKRIDTPRDFIEANLTWGSQFLLKLEGFMLVFDYSDQYASRFPDFFELETNENDVHNKILRGNYAIYGTRINSAFFPENEIRNEDLKNYRFMKTYFTMFMTTFAVQPWLVKPADKIIHLLRETGFVQYHIDDVIHRRLNNALREVLIEHDRNDEGPTVLSLEPLGVGFCVLFLGLSLSTIVFVLELKSATGRQGGPQTIRQVLMDVKKKREIWQREAYKKELKKQRIAFIFSQLKGRKVRFAQPRLNQL